MPINLTFDLTKRRRERELADQLDALRTQLVGTRSEGPPTQFGEVPVEGGMVSGPQADIVSTLLQPATAELGIQGALSLLEQQRQADLLQQKQAIKLAEQERLNEALQSEALQRTPELRALSELVGAGASKDILQAFEPQLSPFTLSSGQERFTGTGGKIAIGPEKAEDLLAKKNKLFQQATTLRKEFTGATKEFDLQNQAYGRVIASAQDPSAAGDLALIFNYMKVLDPGSTVREGEFATAQNAGSVPARAIALYNNVLTGERLETTQRDDFVDRATKLFEQAAKQHKVTAREFRELAKRQNIDPLNVIFQRQTIEPQQRAKERPPLSDFDQ